MKNIQKSLLLIVIVISLYQCAKDAEPIDVDFCSQIKVTDIKVLNADEQSITLNWTNSSIAQSFNVKVFDGSNVVFDQQTINPMLKVEGLRANTTYKMSISPFCNKDLPSNGVKEITAATNGGCNVDAPFNLKTEYTEDKLFKAQWESSEPNLKYLVKLLDKNTKVELISPIETNTNSVTFDIPAGLNGDLIIQPFCKLDKFEVGSKNSLTKNITTESIIISTPFDLKELNINCDVFDTLKSDAQKFYRMPQFFLNFPPYSKTSMINKIPINTKELKYFLIQVGLTTIEFPLVFHNENGNIKIYHNLIGADCKYDKLTKVQTSDKFELVNNTTEEITLEAYNTKLVITGNKGLVRILSIND